MRFFNRLGATEVAPDTICNMAGHVALRYLYGTSVDGFDPRTAKDAACIVVWGANPHASRASRPRALAAGGAGQGGRRRSRPHADRGAGGHSSAALSRQRRGAGVRAAARHPARRAGRPGIHRRARSGLGGTRARDRGLRSCRASRRTGVPAALDRERSRTCTRRDPRCCGSVRACSGRRPAATSCAPVRCCRRLTGNLCKPGAGFLYLNGNLRTARHRRGLSDRARIWRPAPRRRSATWISPTCSRIRIALAALFVWNMNPLASCPQQARLRRALAARGSARPSRSICFPTDTTALADYVLPAASFLEFDDLIASYFHLTLSAQVQGHAAAAARRCRIRRSSAAWAGPWAYRSREFRESDAEILGDAARAQRARRRFRVAQGEGHDLGSGRAAPCSSPTGYSPPRAGGSRRPAQRRGGRPAAACRNAAAIRVPRPAICACCRRRMPGCSTPASATCARSARGWDRPASRCIRPMRRSGSLAEGDTALVHNACGRLELAGRDVGGDSARGCARAQGPLARGRSGSSANVNVLNPGAKSDMGESTAVHSVEVAVQGVPAAR